MTDRHSLPGATPSESLALLPRKIEQAVSAGVDWVQIREKDLAARALAALAREALRVAVSSLSNKARAVRVLVNDRLDVAIAEHAGGIHLGENSLPLAEAKRLIQSPQAKGLLAEDFLLGVSCHSLDAARAAQRSGADYVFFGPVFATPSKAAFGAPQGLSRLAEVCRAVPLPVLAIGGITVENAASCIEAGAAGIAAIRLFQDSSALVRTVDRLRQTATGFRR